MKNAARSASSSAGRGGRMAHLLEADEAFDLSGGQDGGQNPEMRERPLLGHPKHGLSPARILVDVIVRYANTPKLLDALEACLHQAEQPMEP